MANKLVPDLQSLGPLRHACHACGTCCQGWVVELLDDAEIARIVSAGEKLGVPEPVVAGGLRQVDGRCVFLTADKLCRIHSELGPEVKPKVCQYFPRRATKTERGYRVGLDPACTSTGKSWRTGPTINAVPAMQEERVLEREVARSEAALMRLLSAPQATIASTAAGMTGDMRAMPELPQGFASRACAVLRDMDLASVSGLQGADIAQRLAFAVPVFAALDARRAPPWADVLRKADDELALEVMRRQLFLRLGDPAVPPFAQALLLLLGAVGLGWAEPPRGESRFAPAIASWSRLVRAPDVWQRLLPTIERARWLVTGSEV